MSRRRKGGTRGGKEFFVETINLFIFDKRRPLDLRGSRERDKTNREWPPLKFGEREASID